MIRLPKLIEAPHEQPSGIQNSDADATQGHLTKATLCRFKGPIKFRPFGISAGC